MKISRFSKTQKWIYKNALLLVFSGFSVQRMVLVNPFLSLLKGPNLLWADPGVLWKKAPRAMRAMRGKTLETVPFQPYFGCTKSFLKVLSN